LLAQPRTKLDVQFVLGDFPGDTWHFCWDPSKYVLVPSKEVDKIALLFGIQTGLDLHSFGRVFSIDLHGLSILSFFESVGCRGLGWGEESQGYSEAKYT
jgi:hypothetical protein